MISGNTTSHTNRMRRKTVARKIRKTYTLSHEAIEILETERKQRKADSASSALEEMLQERRQQKQMEKIANAITHYYDSLSEEEMNEDRLWGEFAVGQFPLE